MAFRDPSDEARANWDDSLDDYQASRVIMWAAGHLSRHRERYFKQLGRDIVGVGYGKREVRVAGKRSKTRILDEAALKVFVRKKWTKREMARAEESDFVPEWVQVRVPVPAPLSKTLGRKNLEYLWDPGRKSTAVKGWPRWREVALPTDVCAESEAEAQSGPTPLRVVTESASGSSSIEGTSCTLVKVRGTAGTVPFLLGCIHVLMRSLVTSGAVPDPDARNLIPVGDTNQEIGDVHPAKVFDSSSFASLDAALVRLDATGKNLALSKKYWRAQPSGRLISPSRPFRRREHLQAFLEVSGMPVRLYPARGGTITMRYIDTKLGVTLHYQGGNNAQATIFEVLRFAATPHTLGGDSGSPVVAGDWFVGMHVGRPKGTNVSWVIPSFQLLGSNAFLPIPGVAALNRGLDLASDLLT